MTTFTTALTGWQRLFVLAAVLYAALVAVVAYINFPSAPGDYGSKYTDAQLGPAIRRAKDAGDQETADQLSQARVNRMRQMWVDVMAGRDRSYRTPEGRRKHVLIAIAAWAVPLPVV